MGKVSSRRFLGMLLGAIAGVGLGETAYAQSTWDGGGANSNWTNAVNWVGNVAPSGSTADVIFAGSVRINPVLDSSQSVDSVTFNSSSAFTISPSGSTVLTIAGVDNSGIFVNGSGDARITAPVTLGSVSPIATFAATGANLTLTNGLTLTSSASLTLTAAFGRTIELGGPIARQSNSSIISNGAGVVNYVPGSATTSPGATLSVSVGTFNTSSTILGSVFVSGGGVFNYGASTIQSLNLSSGGEVNSTIAGTVTSTSSLVLVGGRLGTGTYTFASFNTDTSSTTSRIIGSLQIGATGSTATIPVSDGTSYTDFQLDGSIRNPTVNVTGDGRFTIGSGSSSPLVTQMTIGVDHLVLDTGTPLASGATISFSGTTGLAHSLTPVINAASTNLRVLSTGAVTFYAGFNFPTVRVDEGGSLNLGGGGQASTIGTLDNSGTVTIPSLLEAVTVGALNNRGTLNNASIIIGDVYNLPGGTFTNTASLSGVNVYNSGLMNQQSTQNYSGSYIHRAGGSLIVSNALGYFVLGGTFGVEGPMTMQPGVTYYVSSFYNSSTLDVNGGGISLNGGSFINTGTISGAGQFGGSPSLVLNTGIWTIDAPSVMGNFPLVNEQQFSIVSGGSLSLQANSSVISNTGTFSLSAAKISGLGTIVNRAGGILKGNGQVGVLINNAGTILADNGTLRLNGAVTNSGQIRLEPEGAIVGTGVITNTGRIQGDGTIASTIVNASGGRIMPQGTLVLTAAPTLNAGSQIQLTAGNTLVLATGASTTSSGLIALSGGALDTGTLAVTNAATGQITGWGNVGTGGLRNSGLIVFAGGSSLVSGPVTNDAGKTIRVQAAYPIFTGLVTNNGTLQVLSGEAIFVGGYTGSPLGVPMSSPTSALAVVGGGSTVLSGGSSLITDGLAQASVNVSSNSTLTVLSREPGVSTPSTGRTVDQSTSVIGTLTIASGSTLDLQSNDMIVTGMSEVAVRALVASWWNGGLRNGAGLLSSLAGKATGLDELATLAVVGNNNAGVARFPGFNGVGLGLNDVLVKYTYLGDTDLDGVVDADDLSALVKGLRLGGTGWSNGDTNYDGVVNGDDMANLLTALRLQQAGLYQVSGGGGAGGGGGAVPEPGGVLPGVMLAMGYLGTRRRK